MSRSCFGVCGPVGARVFGSSFWTSSASTCRQCVRGLAIILFRGSRRVEMLLVSRFPCNTAAVKSALEAFWKCFYILKSAPKTLFWRCCTTWIITCFLLFFYYSSFVCRVFIVIEKNLPRARIKLIYPPLYLFVHLYICIYFIYNSIRTYIYNFTSVFSRL